MLLLLFVHTIHPLSLNRSLSLSLFTFPLSVSRKENALFENDARVLAPLLHVLQCYNDKHGEKSPQSSSVRW
jgi:hypothetical protein